jgi:EAL domain-containing protein (putative c-di-GMP-specific phosphodiesterase class I)
MSISTDVQLAPIAKVYSLNLQVVVEGVEDIRQVAKMERLKCDIAHSCCLSRDPLF